MSDFDTLLSLALNNPKGTPAITPPASIASRVNTPFDLQADVAKVRQEGISKVQAKQAQLSQLASDKRKELGEPEPEAVAPINYKQAAIGAMTGKGNASMGERERALRTLSPSQLIAKYGLTEANEQMNGYTDAAANYRDDVVLTSDRTNGEALYDGASGVVDTLSSGLLGIGALGVGAFNADAGAMISEGASQISEGIRETQSEGIKASRRLFEAKNELDARDNKWQYQQDILEGGNPTIAGLSRYGKDAISAVENIDNMALFTQGTAEGIGSILSGGVVSKGLRAVAGGEKVFRGAKLAKLRADRLGTEVSDAAKSTLTADKWMWAAGVGLQEAGGTYTGTVSTILDTPVAQLYNTSPDFVRLVQQKQAGGMSKEAAEKDARIELANEAGIVAGAAQAPLSALAGKLTSYAEKPFKSTSVANALSNAVLKEPTEEFLQGTTGQVAQNMAVKGYANKDQDLLEGVGESAGTGAVYGLGTAGSLQAPSTIKPVAKVAGKVGLVAGKLAAKGAFAVAKEGFRTAVAVGKPVVNALIARGDEYLSKAGEESPVSDDKVSAAAQNIVETKAATAIPATKKAIETSTATPEKKEQATKYVSSLTQAIEFDEKEVSTLPEKLKSTVTGSKNRAEALQRIAKHIESLPEGVEQLTAAGVLLTLMEPVNKVFESTPDALDIIPKGDASLADMKAYEDVIGTIGQTPSVIKALQTVNEILQSKQMQEMQPITEQAIATPEGKAQADAVIALASVSPESSNEGVVVGLLKMSKEKRLNLTPTQEAALNNSLAIIRAAQALNDGVAQRGLKTSKNVVSSQILSDGENKGDKRSAAVHTQGILAAMRAENIPDATARLEQLGMFAQHMVNKVGALNKHFRSGNPFGESVPYDALNPNTSTFFPSDRNKNAQHKGAYVNTTTETSFDMAQSTELEQKALVGIYNNLVQAFPDLGLNEIQAEDLDSKLIGKPAELVKKFHPNGTPKQKRDAKASKSVTPKAEDKIEDASGISNDEVVVPKFVTPDTLAKDTLRSELETDQEYLDAGFSDKQKEALISKAKAITDDVTNWTDGQVQRIKAKMLRAAINYVKEGNPAVYISMDLANLGGINAFFKDNQDDANVAFLAIADIIKAAFNEIDGASNVYLRTGGDEFGIIGYNVQPKAAEAAMAKAREGVLQYAIDNGFSEIKHLKLGIDKFGVDLYGGITAVDQDDTIATVSARADIGVNTQKGEFKEQRLNVRRSTVREAGAGTPDRRVGQGDRSSNEDQTEGNGRGSQTPQGEATQTGSSTEEIVAPVVPVIKAPEKPIRKEGLNDGQKVAYEKAISFYNSDKKTFSIAGPAGSGKTFLVTSVINALRKANAGMEIVLSSPTHRANTVTRVKNPNDTVKTLHVLLGLKPNVDLSKFNAKDVQFSQGSELDGKFPNNALIIVDESSMINDELYAFLMEKVNAAKGTKIIFLGDNAQLAPVKQLTPSKALTSTDDGAVLTEIMRTEDPALLDESTAVRESGSFTYKSDMKDGKGVSFTNSAKSFVELAINMFGSPAFKTNPLLVRVVAFTNNRVEKFNEVIRLGLFGENPPSYVVGELLMGYSSFGKANQKDGLTPVANGVDYIVQELVSSEVETIFGIDVTIETIKIKDIFGLEGAQTIKILSPKTPKETVKELGLAAAAVIKRAQKDRQVWKREFYPVADTYAFPFDIEYGSGKDGKPLVAMKSTLQYGYAHTIHKSQGGTYTYAMVDDQDIEASRASPSDKQKLRYVGLTRAQQGTYVYTSATLANSLGKKAVAPNLAVAPETTTPPVASVEVAPVTSVVADVVAPVVNDVIDVITPAERVRDIEIPASNRDASDKSRVTRSMFPNLIGQGVTDNLEGNNFVLNFNLPKGDVAPNRIIGDGNPIDTVRSALSSPLKLDTHIQGVAKNALTEELIDAYADVLTIHESAQDLTDDVLFQSEEELAIRRMKYLERSNEQKEFLYQLSKQRETNLSLLPAIHNVGGVMAAMQTNLNMYLSQPVSDQDNTPLNDVIETSDVQYPRTRAGKALNITERVDGKLVYNKPLLESAVLAGMQWRITAKNFETIMDDDDISRYTGIPVDELTDAMKLEISEGMSLKQAKFAIAQKIRAYWGMKSDTDANLAYKDGIVEAVAAEILRAMVDIKMVTKKTIRVVGPDETSKDIKSVDRYIFGEFGDNFAAYPNAIDEAVLTEREEVHYLGGETPPVARTLMNDNSIQLTAAQRSAAKNEQNTPSRLNVPMLNFVNSVGINGLLELFGDGDTKGKLFNKNNLKSVEGANKTITAGFTAINATVANVENRARQFNKKASEIEVRYAYGTSSVGRMHMLGKHNPQASKLMREIMLPTWAKVDLANNAKHIEAFKYAVAQALGIKIHNLGTESFVEMDKLLTTSLAPALEIISNWVTENDLQVTPSKNPSISFPVTELIQAFKEADIKATPVMIHALIEYSRLENMEDKSSFETALYVEADGVTNGPINAMMLMSIGAFTKDFVQNINKGGISIGEAQPMSKLDKNDLYKTSARKAKEHIAALINAIKGQSGENVPAILKHMEHLYNLLSLTMDDIQYTGGVEFSDADLELLRGAVKNPLTVIVYGSSANGVAGKITSMVLDAFYAGLSRTLQNKSKNPALTVGEAFFPDDSNADVKFAQLNDAINALTSSQLNYNREDGFFLDAVEQKPNYTTKSLEEYTFTKGQINSLRENLLIGYVEPLVAGIHETVGTSLIQAVTTMRIASQTQSIVFASMYQTAMDELLADKAKNDPYYKQGDFLSQKDLDSLNAKLAKIMPMVNTGKQVFKITGNKDLDVSETSYSRALNGTMRTAPNIQVPTNAKVKAIAYMTIGTGDGLMMLLLANDGSVVGTLKVFDGMNMPLDKVEVYSQKANGAVYESYKGNPLGSVSTAYNTFLTNKEDIKKLVVDQVNKAKAEAILKKIKFKIYNVPVVAELTRTLSPYIDKDGELLPELFKALEMVQTELNFAAKSADARHKAMQDVPMSVDQMASVGKPFANGKVGLTSDSDIQDKVDALNERYNYYMAQDGTETITDEPIVAPIIAAMGEPTPTGAKVYSWGALHKITKTLTLDENQGNMLRQIYSTFKDNEYRVVVGNAEQIAAYQKSRGLSVQDPTTQDGVKGYVSIPEKTIYILSATGETLVHELIHAASYEIVSAYYHNHPLDSYTSDAVKRIEGLMDQFMTMDTSDMTEAAKEAYLDAKAAIQQYAYNPTLKGADAKAGALNEFMAWAMTNAHLSAKLKATPSLLQLALNVIAEIKNFIFGKKMAPKIGTDMLSALQFNASILMQSQTSLGSISSDATLHHSTQSNDLRLTKLREALVKAVSTYTDVGNVLERTTKDKLATDAMMYATDLAVDVSAVFPMNMEEQVTFVAYVKALSTQAKLDPSAMAKAQEMFVHVTKKLTVDDFIDPNISDDGVARYEAAQKFDVIMGKSVRGIDASNRSALLPIFIALGSVNKEFRDVLKNIATPAFIKDGSKTFDAALDNFGNSMIDKLGNIVAGTSKATNVTQAIDALNESLYEDAFHEKSMIEFVGDTTGGKVDQANDFIQSKLQSLSNAGMGAGQKLLSSNSNVKKAGGAVLQAFSAIVAENSGDEVARGIISLMNQKNVPKPLYNLINDLVGRTTDNAAVYDLIKKIRAQVHQVRQQFREQVPKAIASKFGRPLLEKEWSSLFRGLGKSDLASLVGSMSSKDVLSLVSDNAKMANEISNMESMLEQADPAMWAMYQSKMKQLANYMNTGNTGVSLLRNANAVAMLLSESKPKGWVAPGQATVAMMDKLISLYAVDGMAKADKDNLTSLINNEPAGVQFALDYLVGQRKDEMAKAQNGKAKFNHYKGYIPSVPKQGVDLIVADDSEYTRLRTLGYSRVGAYTGSDLDGSKGKRSYYFRPLSGNVAFSQGMMQNVKHTASGVDDTFGFSTDSTAGRITDPLVVKQLARRMGKDTATVENLVPVYDESGALIAYEKSLDPRMTAKLGKSENLAKMIGIWRGRQVEEKMSQDINEELINNLHVMYTRDIASSAGKKAEYINLLDTASLDPVQRDAVSLFSHTTKNYIEATFGTKGFWVRKDMLDDVTGYRSASVGDVFTGNTRWSLETQRVVRNALIGMFGADAFRKVMNAEQFTQNIVNDLRTLIVVKSVIVPMANMTSNIYQLISRGVPLRSIGIELPKKLAEIEGYTKNRIRQIELEAEIRAVGSDVVRERKLRTELQSITDSYARLSIWPLLQAGEFSSISDVGMTADDLELSSGKAVQWIEKQIDNLPDGMKTAVKNGYIARDTSLFQGLQKSVQYGDFIAKAILYDDLVNRKKLSSKEALGRITEEFVNYDRMPGRSRAYLENMGMLWFFNYKIRIAKVGLSMIRNNPLHALMVAGLPTPGGVGTPITDNIFSKAMEGTLGYSVGPGMAFHAGAMNPFINIIN